MRARCWADGALTGAPAGSWHAWHLACCCLGCLQPNHELTCALAAETLPNLPFKGRTTAKAPRPWEKKAPKLPF